MLGWLMNKEFRDFLKEIASIIVIAFVLAMILRTFVIEGRIIPTGSMLPTLQLQDRVMVNKFIYRFKDIQRGDVIVFAPPEELNSKDDYIKRVIGLPGEKIEVKDSKVYVDDKALVEPYIAEPMTYTYGPVVVPDDCLFVMGDNRNYSQDSHAWQGAWLTMDRVKGKAFVIYWPVKEMNLLQREVSFE